MADNDLIYIEKMSQATELLCTGIYRKDFATYEEFRQTALDRLIKARDLYYEVFDSVSKSFDRGLLQELLNEAERQVRELQLAKTE